jgi:hypothetical protein
VIQGLKDLLDQEDHKELLVIKEQLGHRELRQQEVSKEPEDIKDLKEHKVIVVHLVIEDSKEQQDQKDILE